MYTIKSQVDFPFHALQKKCFVTFTQLTYNAFLKAENECKLKKLKSKLLF